MARYRELLETAFRRHRPSSMQSVSRRVGRDLFRSDEPLADKEADVSSAIYHMHQAGRVMDTGARRPPLV